MHASAYPCLGPDLFAEHLEGMYGGITRVVCLIDIEERDMYIYMYKTRAVIRIMRNLAYISRHIWDHRTMIMINRTSLNSIATFFASSFLQNFIQRHIQRFYML